MENLALRAAYIFTIKQGDKEKAREYFGKACELGDRSGCILYDNLDEESMKKEWLLFLARCHNEQGWHEQILHDDNGVYIGSIVTPCQKILAFANEYFEPIYTTGKIIDDGGWKRLERRCIDSEGPSICYYELKKPLKLRGTLTAEMAYDRYACDYELLYVSFVPSDEEIQQKDLPHFLRNFGIDRKNAYKYLESHFPQWFKDNIAGEVRFEAEIEMSGFFADYSACSSGNFADVKNIVFKKLDEKRYGTEAYLGGDRNIMAKLKREDSYVNLRESPNGKILARIEPKDGTDYFWRICSKKLKNRNGLRCCIFHQIKHKTR